MPPMRAFGRRWHAALDDLPIFAAIGSILHGVWLVILLTIVIAASVRDRERTCPKTFYRYLWAMLAVDLVNTTSFIALFAICIQGETVPEG